MNLGYLACGLDLLDFDLLFLLFIILFLDNLGMFGLFQWGIGVRATRDHVHREIEATLKILVLLVTYVNNASGL